MVIGTVCVYLLMGWGGTVWSSGTVELSDKLNTVSGVTSKSYNQFDYLQAFEDLKSDKCDKIVVGGHSLGGLRAFQIANAYEKKIDLFIGLDPTTFGYEQPSNIKKFVVYQTGGGKSTTSGRVTTIFVDATHTTIDDDLHVHRSVMDNVKALRVQNEVQRK